MKRMFIKIFLYWKALRLSVAWARWSRKRGIHPQVSFRDDPEFLMHALERDPWNLFFFDEAQTVELCVRAIRMNPAVQSAVIPGLQERVADALKIGLYMDRPESRKSRVDRIVEEGRRIAEHNRKYGLSSDETKEDPWFTEQIRIISERTKEQT